MRQEQIKEILERIRSNKNKGTNELAATEEVATLNATNEATLSVASARGITTTTISVDNYLYLESYDENGNAFEEPIIGNYSGTLYTLFGSVNMSSLLAANNLSASDLTACYLTLYGDGGDFSWAYSIYDINGNFVGYWYGGGMQVYVPLKDVYDSSGNWSFVLEPATGYDCLYMSGAGDLEVSYDVSDNENSLSGISITTPPLKTAYLAGEQFDPTGMVVTATYSNGTSKMITDYTYPTTALTAGMTVVTISYMENEIMKTAMQVITVIEFIPTNLIATEAMETIRDFSIAGGSARVDLFNHNSALSFQDISQENNLVGYPINHVYAKTLNNGAFGECFSLNVIEKLTSSTNNGETSYIYKDAVGVGHSFSVANPTVGNWIYLSDAPASVWELSMYKYYQENPIVANRSRFLAVNWLTNGTYTKGFNTFGDLVMISDNYGNYLFIEYDSTGRLINIQDLRNDIGVTAFVLTYNSNGLVKKIEDIVRGKQITYTYTGAKLTGIAYESGRSLSFAYDSDNLTEITSSDGFISVLTYHGPVTSISTRSTVDSVPSGTVSESLPMISEYSLIYKTDFAQVKDIDNNSEYFLFDDNGNLAEYYQEANGLVCAAEKYVYTAHVATHTEKAKIENLNKYSYENFVYEKGEYTDCTLNEFNQVVQKNSYNVLVSIGSYANYQTVYTYDENHRGIKEVVTRTIGSTSYKYITDYTYNSVGQLEKKESYVEGEETSKGKMIEEYTYATSGVEENESEKAKTVYLLTTVKYNSLLPEEKFYSEKNYNGLGKIKTEKTETGEYTTTYTYENSTNYPDKITYPNGAIVDYTYDARDRVTKLSEMTEGVTLNPNNTGYTLNETTAVSSGNTSLRYEYDAKRRLKKVKLGTADYETIIYEDDIVENGYTVNKVTLTNAKSETFKGVEDKKGGFTKVYYNNELQVEKTFNADGTVKQTTDHVTGEVSDYTYDVMGRITNYTRKQDGVQVYAETTVYDTYGQVQSETASGAVTHAYQYAYKNNSARELDYINVPAWFKSMPKTDVLGRNTGKTVKNGEVNLLSSEIFYKTVGDHGTMLPTKIRYTLPTQTGTLTPTTCVDYTYDESGNIKNISYTGNGSSMTYTYDKFNRLIREDDKGLRRTMVYTYDGEGNITSKQQMVYQTDTPAPGVDAITYTYSNGKMTKYNGLACIYDAMGNPTTYKGQRATWTKGRKLTSYRNATFTYDGRGRRISKNSTTYTYDSADRLIKTSNGMEFFYDQEGVAGFTYGGAKYCYQKDLQGNIIGIIDNAGQVVVQYKYDTWGVPRSITTASTNYSTIASLNPFRYRGYIYDSETGFYYLQTRYYDPETCRFLNMDSVDYADPETLNGLNLYAYGLNNPIMYVDPSGHFAISLGLALLIGFVVGAVVGFGATVYTDYKDDGEVFNGSVSAGEYIGNTLIGGAIGTAAAGLIYAAPSIGAAFNTASFATETSGAVAVGIEQAVALATVGAIGVGAILYYSNGRDPIAPRINSPTRKEAYDKAFQKGGKKPPRGPENHGFGWHFHPNVPKGSPYTHWHYFFKKPHILIYLFLGLFSDEEE